MVAVVADRVIVELEAKVARYRRDVTTAVQGFDRGMRRIEGSSRQMERRVNQSFQRAGAAIKRNIGIIVGALGVREVGLYADAWTEAGNKIAAASQVSGIQAESLAVLSKRAIETRVAFEPYIDLYSRLLRSAGQVGASQLEVATATDIVAKSFKAGGASAQEQAAGILQLGQALGSGFLQGDELRSLRENATLLAQAIADEFNTTIGGLKVLGETGQLTSDKVFRAILAGQDKIEAAFAKTNSTIGDGFRGFRTALIRFIGDADDAVGATEGLVAALNALANNLDLIAIALGALAARGIAPLVAALAVRLAAAAATAAAALQLLAVSGGLSFVAMTSLRGAIALIGGPIGAAIIAATALAFAFDALSESSVSAVDGIARLNDAIAKAKTSITDLQGVERSIKVDTERLERANLELNKAVAAGGDAAIAAANADVASINRRIQGNEALRDAILATLKAQQAAIAAEGIVARQSFDQEFGGSGRVRSSGTSLGSTAITSPLQIAAKLFGADRADNSPEAIIDRQTSAVNRLREAALAANEAGTTNEAQANFLRLEAQILSTEEAARQIGETIDAVLSGNTPKAPGLRGAGAGGAGGAKEKLNAFERELASIKKRSDAAAAQISIQGSLNPLVDDYAVSLQTAALATDLLTKAAEAGVEVDAQHIKNLAEGVILLEQQADAARRFGSSVDGIKAVTLELQAQNAALVNLNPLLNDFGFTLTAAEAEQRLLLEAQLAGIEITEDLAAAIRLLAEEYANAVAEGNKLTDAQEKLKEGNQEFRDTAKSALSGFITDIKAGTTAAEALGNALDKIADKLLNLALDNLFSSSGPLGGGGGGAIGGIIGALSGLFATAAKGGVFAGGREIPRFGSGGVSNSAAIFAEAGPEAAVPLPDGRRIPVDLRVADLAQPPQAVASGDQSITVMMNVNGVRDADSFELARPHIMADLNAELQQHASRGTA